jgi:hypothetical protein
MEEWWYRTVATDSSGSYSQHRSTVLINALMETLPVLAKQLLKLSWHLLVWPRQIPMTKRTS